MKIGLQTWGGMGDVRPYMALATALTQAGHEVEVVVTKLDRYNYDEFGRFGNFKVTYTNVDSEEKIQKFTEEARQSSFEFWKFNDDERTVIINNSFIGPFFKECYAAAVSLCKNNDLIIGYPQLFATRCVAEKTNTPYATLILDHSIIPSEYFPPYRVTSTAHSNDTYWQEEREHINRLSLNFINKYRRRAGLLPVNDVLNEVWLSNTLNLINVSAVFCEQPVDWKGINEVCGHFSISKEESHWNIPPDLLAFIRSGSPPIFFTLGSMMNFEHTPEHIIAMCMQAIELAGCRAIVQANWDLIKGVDHSTNVYKINNNISHSSLFPMCAAVVHHGGAGITHTATKYGCPSVIIEYLFDQKFWGHTLQRLGLTTKVLSRRNIDVSSLATEIRAVLASERIKQNANTYGVQMRDENGLKRAVTLIENKFSEVIHTAKIV